MIVSQKLAKPVTGGEPVGLSLFYIKEILMATTHHKSFASVMNVTKSAAFVADGFAVL